MNHINRTVNVLEHLIPKAIVIRKSFHAGGELLQVSVSISKPTLKWVYNEDNLAPLCKTIGINRFVII